MEESVGETLDETPEVILSENSGEGLVVISEKVIIDFFLEIVYFLICFFQKLMGEIGFQGKYKSAAMSKTKKKI